LTSVFAGKIGLAREDITPPIEIYSRSWGAATHDIAAGVHRPLTVTALALVSADGPPLILIATDLGWWKNSVDEWFVRGAVLDALHLPAERLLISLSHTHAGPSLSRDDGDKPGGALIAPYLLTLRDRIIRAARAALASSRPALLSWRYGQCNLAHNRDLPEADTTRHVVGYNPNEPADDTVLVGRIEEPGSGRILATIVNYACHPTTLAWDNRLLSPDYPGAMREVVETVTGAPCLFLQGASGELAPAEQYVGDAAVCDRHGRRLGHAVLSVLESWSEASMVFDRVVESGAALAVFRPEPPATSGELRADLRPIELALKPLPSLAEIEEKWRNCTDRTLRERLWRQRGIRKTVGDGTTAAMPLWTWRIGEALIIAQPNEAYSQLQSELRHRFRPRPVIVLNVTNGYAGYLPPRTHYTRDQYSVWQSPFAAGALENVIETAKTSSQALLNPSTDPLPTSANDDKHRATTASSS